MIKKLFSILSILYANLFEIDLAKMGPTYRAGGKWLIHVSKHYKDNLWQRLKKNLQNIQSISMLLELRINNMQYWKMSPHWLNPTAFREYYDQCGEKYIPYKLTANRETERICNESSWWLSRRIEKYHMASFSAKSWISKCEIRNFDNIGLNVHVYNSV